jgi:hypothetical protein
MAVGARAAHRRLGWNRQKPRCDAKPTPYPTESAGSGGNMSQLS